MALSEYPLPPELALDDPPFDDDDLDEYLAAGDTAEDLAPTVARWSIDDDGAAEWAMRNLVARLRRIDDLARRRDEWMEKIGVWFDQASAGDRRSAEFFEGALADYMRRRRDADPETKSIPLPSGTIRSTGTGGKATVVDPEKVIAWIEETLPDEYDTLVKDEPTVRVAEFRKRATVVKQQVGVEIDSTLLCGHRLVEVWRFDEHDGEDFVAPPASMPCPDCPVDPLDGAPPIVRVSVVGTSPAYEQRVIIDGALVPGVDVEPAGFSVSVKADLS